MRIYTSYYAKVKSSWQRYALVRVSTSIPDWFPVEAPGIPELYPGWDLVSGLKDGYITWAEYRERYTGKLSLLDKADVLRRLKEISDQSGGKDVVLLCYEANNKPCHRHLIAEWLGDVEELG